MTETININEAEPREYKTEQVSEVDKILEEMREIREKWHHIKEDEEAGFRRKIAELESKLIMAREAENRK